MKRAKKIDENKVEYGTVSLPMPLINKIKEKIKGTGVTSVSAYIVFILRQIFSSSNENVKNEKILSKKDESEIKRRLKNLGYID